MKIENKQNKKKPVTEHEKQSATEQKNPRYTKFIQIIYTKKQSATKHKSQEEQPSLKKNEQYITARKSKQQPRNQKCTIKNLPLEKGNLDCPQTTTNISEKSKTNFTTKRVKQTKNNLKIETPTQTSSITESTIIPKQNQIKIVDRKKVDISFTSRILATTSNP